MPSSPDAVVTPLRVVVYDLMSGTNDYGVELVQALAAQHPLTVVAVDDTKLLPSASLRLHAVVPAFAKPQPRWLKALQMARAYAVLIRECLRQPRQTVLHVMFLRFARLEYALCVVLQWLGVRVVCSAHNALPHVLEPWHAAFYRRWYERVDALHVLSDSVLRDIRQLVKAQPHAVVVIGHGPYEGLRQRHGAADRSALRAALGIAPGRFVLLQYGLFKPYKGLHTLAEAFGRLPADLQPLLLLAGAGPSDYLDSVMRQFEAGGRAADLRWQRHYVSDEALCGLLQAADLVLFPYDKVSQSGALFLAMTFGKPCLCAELPGFRESLPGTGAPFFAAGDAAALALKIEQVMRSPALLQALQQQVADAACAGFDWTRIAEQT